MSEQGNLISRPKSVLGILIVSGILFLLISGTTMTLNGEVSRFFVIWGGILLTIGFFGWLFLFLPNFIRTVSRKKEFE